MARFIIGAKIDMVCIIDSTVSNRRSIAHIAATRFAGWPGLVRSMALLHPRGGSVEGGCVTNKRIRTLQFTR